jgi:phospholipid-binding lipoprotein MlaA
MVVALVTLGMLAGCATTSGAAARDPYDPLEPLNRQVFAFNQFVDRAAIRPIARTYDEVVPGPVKTGVGNFFENLSTPIWAFNHVLQGDLAEAGLQTGRFLLNSTGGILGLFDVATPAGLEKSRATYDQTFGVWGIPSGPYLMLPFLGPTTVRGGAAIYARFQTDLVWNYLDDNRSLRDKLTALEIIDLRRRLLPLDRTLRTAPDPYIFVREAYRQRSQHEIRQRRQQDVDVALEFEDEDWGDEEQELQEP